MYPACPVFEFSRALPRSPSLFASMFPWDNVCDRLAKSVARPTERIFPLKKLHSVAGWSARTSLGYLVHRYRGRARKSPREFGWEETGKKGAIPIGGGSDGAEEPKAFAKLGVNGILG